MRAMKIPVIFISILLFMSGCVAPSITEPKDEYIAAVVRFSNSLVPALFQTYAGNNSNLVVAPFGLATCIAITMECVNGEAFQQITNLFKVTTKNARQDLRRGFQSILKDFHESGQAQGDKELAGSYNKVFLKNTKIFPTAFMQQLTKFYGVDAKSVNFTFSEANITGQVLELRTDAGIMSHWRNFQSLVVYTYLSHTPSAPFYGSGGNTTLVPMIPLVGSFRAGYMDKLQCQAAELLFENRIASLLLLMPHDLKGNEAEDSLVVLQRRLFADNFFEVLNSLPIRETRIFLPQMSSITNNLELASFLGCLGMTAAFGNHGTNGIFAQSVKQNAFFSTSFTTFNSISTHSSNYMSRRKRDAVRENVITFNRPFLFFLIHRESGLIMLAGQIRRATQFPTADAAS